MTNGAARNGADLRRLSTGGLTAGGLTAGGLPSGGLPSGGLRSALDSGRFVITAELGPPRGADPEAIRRKATMLRGWVDAANITDNQSAHVRLSSFAGSVLAHAEGVEPVMQLTCRDRNRIALQSDLLSAAALGIPNILLLTGDHPRFGDHPEAKAVFDLDGVQLVWTARTMRDQGRLLSGRRIDPAPRWLIGTVENPFSPPTSFRARRLAKKVAAGAEFAQTQFVFDLGTFERFMADVRDLGVDGHCGIIAGVGPVRSLRALEFMRTKVPGIHIPDDMVRRLRGVTADRVAEEGMRICIEIIQRLTEIRGVAGAHVMAFGYEQGIPEILERAGVGPHPVATAPDYPAPDHPKPDHLKPDHPKEGSGCAG
ncbi:MAG: methylenetetrahydrofolate reductase [Pseudonocardiaceae bacterium]